MNKANNFIPGCISFSQNEVSLFLFYVLDNDDNNNNNNYIHSNSNYALLGLKYFVRNHQEKCTT